jgi:hypothetical protein
VKRQRKNTSPRRRRDHAKYKDGGDRKVQILKRRLAEWCKIKMDDAYHLELLTLYSGSQHDSGWNSETAGR